jgi:hypothetical protein
MDPPYYSNHYGLGYSNFFLMMFNYFLDLPIFINHISLHIISQ